MPWYVYGGQRTALWSRLSLSTPALSGLGNLTQLTGMHNQLLHHTEPSSPGCLISLAWLAHGFGQKVGKALFQCQGSVASVTLWFWMCGLQNTKLISYYCFKPTSSAKLDFTVLPISFTLSFTYWHFASPSSVFFEMFYRFKRNTFTCMMVHFGVNSGVRYSYIPHDHQYVVPVVGFLPPCWTSTFGRSQHIRSTSVLSSAVLMSVHAATSHDLD